MLLTIRKATSFDLDDITQLFSETIEAVNANDYSPQQINAWKKGAFNKDKWLKKIFEQYFLVCVTKNKIVGFGSITTEGYLDFMYVSKDHQGRGVASKIYDSLEKFAIDNAIEKIISDVSITAKPFFERKGFEVLQQQQVDIDGIELTNYKMQKRLTLP